MLAALFKRTLLPAFAALVPLAAQAGEVTTGTGTYFDCAATYSGPIESGDLAKIRLLDTRSFAGGARPLCLNSQGGEFTEAFAIADFLHDRGIPTAVDDGAECLGACAFVFMGGRAQGEPSKSLHLNAILGFGGPQLSYPDGAFSAEQMNEAFNLGRQAAGQIASRMDRFQISADLAAKVIALPQNDLLYIRRVDEARALGLRLEGFETPRSLGDKMVTRACIRKNSAFDPLNSSAGQSVYDNRVLREAGASAHRKATYLVEAIVNGVPSWIGCQVELTTGADAVLRLRASSDWVAGGNPPLRNVHTRLVQEAWTDFPARDFGKLIPENQTLQEARKMSAPDASGSIIVDPVGDLPRTTAGTEAQLALRFDDRQEIQNRLTLLGFDTRGADGIFGPGTRAALREWQKSNGLDETGFLDIAQRDMLFRQSDSQYQVFAENRRRDELEQERLRNTPAPVFRRPTNTAPDPAPTPQPQGQRVRVCQRTIFGELVNCRIEFR